MSYLRSDYTFDASAGTISFGAAIEQDLILGIWNALDGVKLYDPHTTGALGTVASPVLTIVDVDTTSMSDSDPLLIFYGQNDPIATATLQSALNSLVTTGNGTLVSILAKLIATPATEGKQNTIITILNALGVDQLAGNALLTTIAGKDFATQTTLAAVLAKIIAAPATEAKQDTGNSTLGDIKTGQVTVNTALADILAKLIAAPSTEAKQDAEAVLIGGVTESAPGTDTASSGLNGRLQRIAQRITSFIALIPAALSASGNFKVAVLELPKSTTANTPAMVTSAGDTIASNASRKSWGIQNCGTNTLYVRMGTGASATEFHFALAPGLSADDGLGRDVEDKVYTGVVSIAGTSPRCTFFEL